MWYELKLAIRRLLGERLLTTICVGIIAVGIATTTALFSLTDALLFKPLPFADADRLIAITTPFEVTRRLRSDERQAERERLEATHLVAQSAFATPGLLFEDWAAAEANVVQVDISPNFFQMLGIGPIRGHILPDPPSNDADAPEVLLGYDLWRSQFGGDEGVLGRTVTVAGRSIRAVAVMPPGIEFPHSANLWRIQTRRSPSAVPNYARLSPDVTVEQLAGQFPRLNVERLRDAIKPAGAFTIAYLLGATTLVLIVGWVQVGGLLVSRTAGRASGIGIRLALGASRRRLLWEFLAEGAVLAAMALIAAWLLLPFMLEAILRLLPPEMIRGQAISADWRSFLFACAVSAMGVVLLSVFPLRILAHSNPAQSLQRRGALGINLSANRVRTGLIVTQLAVTCLLLYVTGLAMQSLWRVSSIELGFVPEGVVALPLRAASTGAQFRTNELVIDQVLEEIRSLPGVASAAACVSYPTQRGSLRGTAQLPSVRTFDPLTVRVNHVTEGFFATLRIRMVEGRDFKRGESKAEPVAIVNEALAALLRPHGAVIDQMIQVTSMRGRIVGIADNYVDERPDVPSEPQIFFLQRSGIVNTLLLRESGAAHVLPAVRAALERTYGPGTGERMVRLADGVRRATADYRGRGVLLSALAAVAITLVLAGVAGAVSYSTRQRTREIAIHIALGAEPVSIRRRIIRWAVLGIAAGSLGGVGGGVVAARWASSLWFGVSAVDPFTAAGVVGLVIVTGIAAAYFPAREASRVDPALALREH